MVFVEISHRVLISMGGNNIDLYKIYTWIKEGTIFYLCFLFGIQSRALIFFSNYETDDKSGSFPVIRFKIYLPW